MSASEPSHLSHDPYKIEDETPLPPVIKRKPNPETDAVFLKSLAKAYRVEPNGITVVNEGGWKLFKINNKVIFRDHE